jgi:ligand-binding sensor protein
MSRTVPAVAATGIATVTVAITGYNYNRKSNYA